MDILLPSNVILFNCVIHGLSKNSLCFVCTCIFSKINKTIQKYLVSA